MKTKSPLWHPSRVVQQHAALILCTGAALAFAGCASEPDSHVVSAPPPATAPVTASSTPMIVQTPAQSGSGSPSTASTVVVTQAPPIPQTEPVLEQPTPQHVWIPGYWSYRGDRYVWIAGRWELPPRTDAVWIAPRWEREGNAYRFYEGYWQ